MKKGFTLFEVLAAILLITLVSVLTVPAIVNFQNKIKEKNYNNKIRLITEAVESYVVNNPNCFKPGIERIEGLCLIDNNTCSWELINNDNSVISEYKYTCLISTLANSGIIKYDGKDSNNNNIVLDPRDNSASLNDVEIIFSAYVD